jgi:universal stress protein A
MVLKNVLVTIEFDELTETTLVYARTLARALHSRLHVMHVMANTFLRPMSMDPAALPASISRQVDQRLTDDDRQTLQALPVVRMSDAPADEIVRYAQENEIDLIVMGTHGRKGVAHMLLGSVAERVVRTAPCPVLTVKDQYQPSVTEATVLGEGLNAAT